jgi:hypothetical protein
VEKLKRLLGLADKHMNDNKKTLAEREKVEYKVKGENKNL